MVAGVEGFTPGDTIFEREWAGLAERRGASPFHHPGWVRAWWSAFGRGAFQLIALRGREGLLAVLPMAGSGRRLRSPTNWHTPVFGPIADSPTSAGELLDGMFTLGYRSVDMSFLDEEDGTRGLVAGAAERAGWSVATRVLERSPWISLDSTWHDYEQTLPRGRRKAVRRCMRRLREQGTVSLDVRRGDARLGELLGAAFRIEASGWKGRRGTAMASRPETRSFYSAVATWAAERGWLRLTFLRLDDTPIAFDLSLEHRDVRYSLKAGYDVAFARYGPGALLLHEIVRDGFATGLERFELLGPEDEFKLDWTDRASPRAWLRACAPSAAGRAEARFIRAREGFRPLARRIRDGTMK